MIFQHTWQKVLDGTKTQTRRYLKPYTHYLLYTLEDDVTITAVLQNNREQWRVGNTYAVQPGRGQKAVGRIRITGIRQERLQAITDSDAVAEGVSERWATYTHSAYGSLPVAEYRDLWNAIHTKPGERWEDDPPVFVIEFELVKGDE